jgi:hypothetical protein
VYVGSWYSKITNTAKKNTLVTWCNQNGIKSVAPYGADGMLGNVSNENILSDGINFLHSKGITFGAIATDVTGYTRFKNYMDSHTGLCDYTLREREVWNDAVALQPQAIVDDSLAAMVQKLIGNIYGAPFGPYIGWQCQGKRFLNMVSATSNQIFLHVYRLNPLDYGYAKSRLDDINAYCLSKGIIMPIVIIVSLEPAFSQVFYKTHSFDETDAYWQPIINGYSNIKYKGLMIFLDDFAMISKPVSLPITSFAARLTNYSVSEFKNVTDTMHLRMATEPNDK